MSSGAGHAVRIASPASPLMAKVSWHWPRRAPRPVPGYFCLTSDGKSILALAEARAAVAGVSYETKLAYGDVATTILQAATEQQCDVVVLGSRGLTGFKRLMLGSISNAVAATAPVPVLIVKRFLLT